MKEFVIPSQQCPYCGYQMDRTSGVNHDDAPTPGGLSICFHCSALSIFDDDLRVRKMSAEELLEKQRDRCWPMVEKTVAAIRKVQRL